jgi:hypothetical protein
MKKGIKLNICHALVYMNHAIKEGPEKYIGEQLAKESVGEQLLSAAEKFLPVVASFPEQHQPQRCYQRQE